MGYNRDRAEMLMEDIKAWQPERAKKTSIKKLEKFLDQMDEKQDELLQTMIAKIPKNLPPEEYEQEVSWKRQEAQELIQEEISQLYR